MRVKIVYQRKVASDCTRLLKDLANCEAKEIHARIATEHIGTYRYKYWEIVAEFEGEPVE